MIGHPLSVQDIIAELKRGGIRIPEIQRGYVWKRAQIAQLLDSLYRGFPTGSLLLWDTDDPQIVRNLNTDLGAAVTPDFAPKIVLDGQQRITSLGRVFDPKTDRQDRVFFNALTEAFEVYSPRMVADPSWLDTTELLSDGMTELDVMDRLTEAGIVSSDNREHRNMVHSHLKKLSSIRQYKYPVEIVREDDLEVVTEVFIRVNSGGTRLREAELALARLAWRLPGTIVGPFEQMQNACMARGFDLDTRFLMRSLIAVATGQSRFTDLKAFWKRPAQEIQDAWERTENGVRLALDFVEGNVGIPGTIVLASQFSLIPLVAVFATRKHLTGEEERVLRRWFLMANAFSHYVGASETKLNQDLTALGPDFDDIYGLMDQLMRDLRGQTVITPRDLERAGTNSPFFPLAWLATIEREAKDWFLGILLRRSTFAEDQNIEYHHIFPKKLLDARNVDRYKRDEMANIAFLGQKANRRILATEPKVYLAEIADRAPTRLEDQFVPMDRNLWELDCFDEFLEVRRQNLADAVNKVLTD